MENHQVTAISQQALKRWGLSPTRWLSDVDAVFIHPDTKRLERLADFLFPYQVEVLEKAARIAADGNLEYDTIILSIPKQNGKSVTEAIWMAWRLCCFPRQFGRYIANSREQAASVGYGYLTVILEQSPKIQSIWKPYVNKNQIYVPTMRSRCEAISNSYRRAAGDPIDALVGEEVGLMDDVRAFNISRSQTTPRNAQTFIASTVGLEENALWKMIEADTDGKRPKTFCKYFRDNNPSPRITEGWLASRREGGELTPQEYDMYHRNVPAGEARRLIKPEMIDACQTTDDPRTWEEFEALADEGLVMVGGALDRATIEGADETIGAITGAYFKNDEWHYQVLDIKTFDLSTEAAIKKWVLRANADWSLAMFVWEQYQCEDLFRWSEGEGIPSRFEHAQGSKQLSAFTRLLNLIASGRLHIPARFEKLFYQLKVLTEQVKGARRVVFQAKPGEHDDAVYAALWAIDGIKDYFPPRISMLQY